MENNLNHGWEILEKPGGYLCTYEPGSGLEGCFEDALFINRSTNSGACKIHVKNMNVIKPSENHDEISNIGS